MTQIINQRDGAVNQVLEGVAFIHQDKIKRVAGTGIITRNEKATGKVAIISGGGSGHEPAHFGYVGKGMLDASVSGPLFVPPSSGEIFQAIESVATSQGVLLIVKNFSADVKEFEEARQLAIDKGYLVEMIIVNDDCSVDEESLKKRRRGVAGTIFIHKIIGAAAQEGQSLSALKQLGEAVILSTNTLGVAMSSGQLFGKKDDIFQLADNHISFGIGIHGEEGYRTEVFYSSEYLANELVNKLLSQYDLVEGKSFAVLINGLGSTTAMEQYIFSNDLHHLLKLADVKIVFQKAGNFMTSTNMAGISVSLLEIKDEKWLDYLNSQTTAFAW